ncbi:MAG: hypothetical protein HY901_05945 [Deltaproteobacteria bacterium]|nr:hypothetical protein [Deltaproteobacteria bacterium]
MSSSAFEKVLRLRPSSVAGRLSGSRVCLLNARDVQRSLGSGLVVACEAPAEPIAAGIARAARHQGAAIGLSFPALPFGEAPRAHAASQLLLAAVQESGLELPLFLRAGPIPISEATEAGVSQAREAVFRLVDGGFTEACLDVSRLGPSEAGAAVAEAGAALRERELSLEVATGTVDPHALAELAGSLGVAGVRADVMSLKGAALANVEDLGPLVRAIEPTALAVVDPLGPVRGSGVRRVVISAPFCRVAVAALPEEAKDAIRAKALEGWSIPAAIAQALKRAVLSEEARERMEALAYLEAMDVLEAAGARASGSVSLTFLSERSGY